MDIILSILATTLILVGLFALMFWSIRSAYRYFGGGCHGSSPGNCENCGQLSVPRKFHKDPSEDIVKPRNFIPPIEEGIEES